MSEHRLIKRQKTDFRGNRQGNPFFCISGRLNGPALRLLEHREDITNEEIQDAERDDDIRGILDEC